MLAYFLTFHDLLQRALALFQPTTTLHQYAVLERTASIFALLDLHAPLSRPPCKIISWLLYLLSREHIWKFCAIQLKKKSLPYNQVNFKLHQSILTLLCFTDACAHGNLVLQYLMWFRCEDKHLQNNQRLLRTTLSDARSDLSFYVSPSIHSRSYRAQPLSSWSLSCTFQNFQNWVCHFSLDESESPAKRSQSPHLDSVKNSVCVYTVCTHFCAFSCFDCKPQWAQIGVPIHVCFLCMCCLCLHAYMSISHCF